MNNQNHSILTPSLRGRAGVGLLFLLLFFPLVAHAADVKVENVRHAGPFVIKTPVLFDSLSVSQQKFSVDNLIGTPLSLSATDKSPVVSLHSLMFEKGSLNLLTFTVDSRSYAKASVEVKGAKNKKVFADGKEQNGKAVFEPGHHVVAIKFIADSTGVDVSLNGDSTQLAALQFEESAKMPFTMTTNLATRVTRSASQSASGRWVITQYSWYDEKNKVQYATRLIDTTNGRQQTIGNNASWMPASDRYYFTETIGTNRSIITVNPATGERTIFADNIPEGGFMFSPTEDYLVFYVKQDGPKHEDGVFEIVHPDDRQPGWRNRQSLSRYDVATGFVQPLTYGYQPIYVSDISMDGRYLLFSVQTDSLTQRPTTRQTFMRMDVRTLSADTLVVKDGFISSGKFTKNNDVIVFKASPESFGGIGNLVPKEMTPSMFDYHLYLFDARTKKVKPLTAADATCVEDYKLSPVDGNVYYTAERGDSVLLYRLDMKTLRSSLIAQPLEDINGLSLSLRSKNIIVHGSSACTPYRVYSLPMADAKGKAKLLIDPNAELFSDVALGTCHPWQFRSKRGDIVTGHYYMPANYDASKKYPVIVHYYGGCSPTSRRFGGGSHYPAHYWNALGYITFIVNPSGATGFGQEWAARHVNTMGAVVVDDIIEATEQFCKDVPQADADHLGCVSASYGGFMTQNILIHTDMFKCGISHAGISDHTSYWGEGFWGYSYSETCAANSYPWTRKDLFVDRSPLYNAEKIHTPLLFTHGTADTNVPIGESIQMYTALRLLGCPTAFIEVEGENHGIMDPVKRAKWINSMMAWFQKYLKNDSSWWNAMYPEKKL